MVEKLNKFKQILVHTITKLRSKNKRPDAKTMFKDIQKMLLLTGQSKM